MTKVRIYLVLPLSTETDGAYKTMYMQVVPTLLIAEILMVLLGAKTNDSVELAVTALKEAGALLQDIEPQMLRM